MYRVFCCNKFIRTCHSGVKQPAYWVHFRPVPKEQIHLHTSCIPCVVPPAFLMSSVYCFMESVCLFNKKQPTQQQTFKMNISKNLVMLLLQSL